MAFLHHSLPTTCRFRPKDPLLAIKVIAAGILLKLKPSAERRTLTEFWGCSKGIQSSLRMFLIPLYSCLLSSLLYLLSHINPLGVTMSFINKPIYVTINGYTYKVSMTSEKEFLDFINKLNSMLLVKSSWTVKEGDSPTEPAKVSFSNYLNKQ
jgi:hypothetical protein